MVIACPHPAPPLRLQSIRPGEGPRRVQRSGYRVQQYQVPPTAHCQRHWPLLPTASPYQQPASSNQHPATSIEHPTTHRPPSSSIQHPPTWPTKSTWPPRPPWPPWPPRRKQGFSVTGRPARYQTQQHYAPSQPASRIQHPATSNEHPASPPPTSHCPPTRSVTPATAFNPTRRKHFGWVSPKTCDTTRHDTTSDTTHDTTPKHDATGDNARWQRPVASGRACVAPGRERQTHSSQALAASVA
jgi:hypothetical protein